MRFVFSVLTSLFVSMAFIDQANANIKVNASYQNPQNKKVFKSITLPNKMEVLLVSDPNFNTSSAALDVRVGSYANPREHQGMAHYLEHLLFLGTKSYPVTDEYMSFIEKNQGQANAYTAEESTNYQFQINNNAFEEALKRLSSFFIEPLFDKRFVEKELTAVDSEFQGNIDKDEWRSYFLLNHLAKKDHPYSAFTIGSKESLKSTTVEDVKQFYEKYYSANVMKLVLMSPKSTDELEKIAQKYFGKVKNKNLKPQKYSDAIYDPADLPMHVDFKPIKNENSLSLNFILPATYQYWKSKPLDIIAGLIGYEGENSLFSLLKKEGLATELSAGSEQNSFSTRFTVNVKLTDKGVKEYHEVVKHFFAFVKLLEKEGYKEFLFEEKKALAEINYVTKEHYEGMWIAAGFANQMQIFPGRGKDMEKDLYLIHQFGPKEFSSLLQHINPDKLILLRSSQSVTTTDKDPYFGAEYTKSVIPSETIKSWKNADIHSALKYPSANPYVSKELVLYQGGSKIPRNLINPKWGEFYFQFDNQFSIPKAEISLLVQTPIANATPADRALANLYVKALNKSLEEWRYPILEAGMNYSVALNDRGIALTFSGYTEKLPVVMEELTKKLKVINLSENEFNEVKADTIKDIENFYKEESANQAIYATRYLLNPDAIHFSKIYDKNTKVDLLSAVTLPQVNDYAKKLYESISFEGAAFGNISDKNLLNAIVGIQSTLGSKILDQKLRKQTRMVKLSQEKQFLYPLTTETNNNALFLYVDAGPLSMKSQAVTAVGDSILSSDFFTVLRTNQQLGYIVQAWSSKSRKSQGLNYLIQSSDYTPEQLYERIDQWLRTTADTFNKISDKDFAELKNSVIIKLKNQPKNQRESLKQIYDDYFSDDLATYGYKNKVAEEVAKLQKKDVVDFYTNVLIKNTRNSIQTNTYKKGVKPGNHDKFEVIKDADIQRTKFDIY